MPKSNSAIAVAQLNPPQNIRLIVDAAIVGQLRLVKMLVERGADPCFKNRKGKTPCDVAAAAVHNFLITARGEFAC